MLDADIETLKSIERLSNTIKDRTVYEITFIETATTIYLTEKEARACFGKDEWVEYKAGYLPHVVVVEI